MRSVHKACIASQLGAEKAEGRTTGGGGEQGHSKEKKGCVFTDLDRAMNPSNPSHASSPTTLPHH